MITYRRGETPKLWAVFETKTLQQDGTWSSGTLASPATVQVIIEDSTGTVVQALTSTGVTESSTGIFYYAGYTIPTDANTGIWNWEMRGSDGSSFSSYYGSFEVKKQVA